MSSRKVKVLSRPPKSKNEGKSDDGTPIDSASVGDVTTSRTTGGPGEPSEGDSGDYEPGGDQKPSSGDSAPSRRPIRGRSGNTKQTTAGTGHQRRNTDSSGDPRPGTSGSGDAKPHPTGEQTSFSAIVKGLTPKEHSKPEVLATCFKLIDERDWSIATSEPDSQISFYREGHAAMSVIAVVGPQASGKSTLLNMIARRQVFQTHRESKSRMTHMTRGVDIYSDKQKILLDCQPMLSSSVLDDFISGRSASQFSETSITSNPLTSSYMISLQLLTFLLATTDHIILTTNWVIDVSFLKLVHTAIMLLGESHVRAKLVFYSRNKMIFDERFKKITEFTLGRFRIARFFLNINELVQYVTPYSSIKSDLYLKDPSLFTGRNFITSCQKIWNKTVKSSALISEYAFQIANK